MCVQILFQILTLLSYLSTHLPDFYETLLKSGKWLPAALQMSSMQIRDMCQPSRETATLLAVFKTVGEFLLILLHQTTPLPACSHAVSL
jgi:hypothetical protein